MSKKRAKGILIVSSISMLVLSVVLIVLMMNMDSSKTDNDTAENQEKEYAYKAITGQESPALHESVAKKDSENESEWEGERQPLTDKDEIKRFEEETGFDYTVIEDERSELLINRIFNGLYGKNFREDATKVDVDEQYRLTMEHPTTAAYAKELETQVEKFITDSFTWHYKNKENKEGYLAYRVGEYFYEDRVYNASEMYDLIHEKMKAEKLSMEVDFEKEKSRVYLHPNGGYIIDKTINLTFNKDDKENGIVAGKPIQFNYRGEFNFKMPSEEDLWYLWTENGTGVLTLTGEYVY